MLNDLLCAILGHKINQDAYKHFGDKCCDRCDGYNVSDSGFRDLIRTIRFYCSYWTLGKLQDFKNWFRCRECKKYCGHHDDSVDHIPF